MGKSTQAGGVRARVVNKIKTQKGRLGSKMKFRIMVFVTLVFMWSNVVFAQLKWDNFGATDKDNLTAELGFDGTLIIRGTGNMKNFGVGGFLGDNRPWTKNTSAISKVVIDSGVTSIGTSAFMECKNLKIVNMGNSVIYIGKEAFKECENLKTVTMSNSVTTIGDWAFARCGNLTSIVIPNSITSIGEYAFSRCGITSVNIPSGVISGSAFALCKNLTTVTIGDSVTSIGEGAFASCEKLKSVKIGNSVTSIGRNAFTFNSLTSITIPSSVTSIGSGAFDGCKGLKSITSLNPTPPAIDSPGWGTPFYGMDKTICILYVPKGSPYSLINFWNEFKNIKYLP